MIELSTAERQKPVAHCKPVAVCPIEFPNAKVPKIIGMRQVTQRTAIVVLLLVSKTKKSTGKNLHYRMLVL